MKNKEIGEKVEEFLTARENIGAMMSRDYASELFRGKKIEIDYIENGISDGRDKLHMKLNDEITFFFYQYEDGWKFDGWEISMIKD